MKILVIDQQGNALDWCLRCQDEGHDIRWFVKMTTKTEHIGRGLVKIVPDWRDHLKWADLILLSDNTLYLKELDAWRRENPKGRVIGATIETAEWELDRSKGMAILEKHGIETPPHKTFSNYDQAIAYVKKEGRRFVSKPSGDADKALSYVSKDAADLVYMLERWKRGGKLKGEFILQEFIGGIEFAVGGWFGPGGFNQGFLENMEFKKLMPGDCGPNTGEMGTVISVVRKSKIARKVLEPLADALDRAGYVGYVDVNTIVDDEGTPWPLEFTMRPGWPTFNIQQALNKGDPAEWLAELADGRDARNWDIGKIAVGVVMAIGDFPHSHLTRREVVGVPIYGLKPSVLEHVHPCEIMAGEAPQLIGDKVVTAPCWVTAGDYVLVTTGVGDTVREAARRAYAVLDKISIPTSPIYRNDIGRKLAKQLPQLHAMGYATTMEYAPA